MLTLVFLATIVPCIFSVITFPGLLITMVTCIRIMSVLESNKNILLLLLLEWCYRKTIYYYYYYFRHKTYKATGIS